MFCLVGFGWLGLGCFGAAALFGLVFWYVSVFSVCASFSFFLCCVFWVVGLVAVCFARCPIGRLVFLACCGFVLVICASVGLGLCLVAVRGGGCRFFLGVRVPCLLPCWSSCFFCVFGVFFFCGGSAPLLPFALAIACLFDVVFAVVCGALGVCCYRFLLLVAWLPSFCLCVCWLFLAPCSVLTGRCLGMLFWCLYGLFGLGFWPSLFVFFSFSWVSFSRLFVFVFSCVVFCCLRFSCVWSVWLELPCLVGFCSLLLLVSCSFSGCVGSCALFYVLGFCFRFVGFVVFAFVCFGLVAGLLLFAFFLGWLGL